jgi:hypothetical protein
VPDAPGGIANAGRLTLIDAIIADNTPDDVSQVEARTTWVGANW